MWLLLILNLASGRYIEIEEKVVKYNASPMEAVIKTVQGSMGRAGWEYVDSKEVAPEIHYLHYRLEIREHWIKVRVRVTPTETKLIFQEGNPGLVRNELVHRNYYIWIEPFLKDFRSLMTTSPGGEGPNIPTIVNQLRSMDPQSRDLWFRQWRKAVGAL